MRARIVRVDGTTEQINLPDEGEPMSRLRAMYAAIGCEVVDVVRVVPAAEGRLGLDMWLDDEGLYRGLPNVIATNLVWTLMEHFTGEQPTQAFMGDVLFTGGPDSEGDTLGLSAMQDAVLAEMAKRYRERLTARITRAVASTN